MDAITFQLTDAHGADHTYNVERFSCDENASFQLALTQPVFEAIGKAIGAFAPGLAGGGLDALKDGDWAAIAERVSQVDWESAVGALNPIPAMIEAREGPAFIAKIFAKTVRLVPIPEAQGLPTARGDGAGVTDIQQPLSHSRMRDQAFGDGNMREYWQAAVMVLLVNFTQLGRRESADWSDAVKTMTAGLWTRSKAIIETAERSNATASAS